MTNTTETTMTEEVILDAPASLLFSDEEMRSERPARLLEAGTYPDKKLTLTEDDLDEIAARFSGDVPVKVEHVDSPLDPLGTVRRVWREGTALLGMLAFPDDLAGFLRRRGAAKLSVGLAREPLALREVSLVLKPRVASATLMSEPTPPPGAAPLPKREGEELVQELAAIPSSSSRFGGSTRSEERTQGEGGSGLRSEITRLTAALAAREVDAQIAAFKAQGRIVPASEGPARALLAAEGEATVSLSDGPEPLGRVFKRFLEAQPPVVLLSEVAPGGAGESAFTQSEQMFLSQRLGVDPARVAETLRAAREKKGDDHAH